MQALLAEKVRTNGQLEAALPVDDYVNPVADHSTYPDPKHAMPMRASCTRVPAAVMVQATE